MDPPLEWDPPHNITPHKTTHIATIVDEWDLPVIDLQQLVADGEEEREKCKRKIVEASMEWGFFQVVNHGVSRRILEEMLEEQVKVFREPFSTKKGDKCMSLGLSSGSYRWGSPAATSLMQLCWSEVFHIPLNDIFSSGPSNVNPHVRNLCSIAKQFASTIYELADKLAKILAANLCHAEVTYFEDKCVPNTCYLRMNRYPPCPKYCHMLGLMPHTDSDFLTILYQDQVGGLQLVKDEKWISVRPNPDALIVNIGDLFQAWSNGVYKSVVHQVIGNPKVERSSTAFFLCPSSDDIIQSYKGPSIYKSFSFGEYRQQVQEDVKIFGHKIGLSRFLVCN